MSKIGIETTEYEPTPFEPNPQHITDYEAGRSNVQRTSGFAGNDAAIFSAVLALAAQMARIADAIEFVVKENV